jgi:DNA-directed RNA polymerase specialized sigma24 family protein
MVETMEEVELMQRVGTGDMQAMSRLVDMHYDAIYRLLRHVSGSREDAQDLAQDVFMIAAPRARALPAAVR